MKQSIPVLFFLLCVAPAILCQDRPRNIFIITIDGFRWQELFNGADPSLLRNEAYVQDTALAQALYNDSTPGMRRNKLLPFFWGVIGKKGQLLGNRQFANRVDVSNLYKISYPGYSEMLTGYADPVPILNTPTPNRRINVLEQLDRDTAYSGKVVAFSSWNIFPFIINEKRNGLPVNSGYERTEGSDTADMYINTIQEQADKTACRYDRLTYLAAREYIRKQHPRVVMIGFGETDEFAHQRRYDLYLQHVNAIDRMMSELWYLIQTDPYYRNNTYLLLTTDHGRGRKADAWFAHNPFVRGSGEAWQAMMGPGIAPVGEVKTPGHVYQKQIAGTVAALLGKTFRGSDRPLVSFNLPANNQQPGVVTETGYAGSYGVISSLAVDKK